MTEIFQNRGLEHNVEYEGRRYHAARRDGKAYLLDIDHALEGFGIPHKKIYSMVGMRQHGNLLLVQRLEDGWDALYQRDGAMSPLFGGKHMRINSIVEFNGSYYMTVQDSLEGASNGVYAADGSIAFGGKHHRIHLFEGSKEPILLAYHNKDELITRFTVEGINLGRIRMAREVSTVAPVFRSLGLINEFYVFYRNLFSYVGYDLNDINQVLRSMAGTMHRIAKGQLDRDVLRADFRQMLDHISSAMKKGRFDKMRLAA